ncbi:hypothetical protein REPUB_Repub03eG0000200 [Reevesia pubescens]
MVLELRSGEGIVKRFAHFDYNWSLYVELFKLISDSRLKLHVALSFHSKIHSSNGKGGVDQVPMFSGRTALQCYEDFMLRFVNKFEYFIESLIEEIGIGLGPSGELRYPAHPFDDGRGKFPGIGEFQCYDKYMQCEMQKAVFKSVKIDTRQPPYVFKCLLYYLTGVPPERQKIMVKGGLLKDDADWSSVGVKQRKKLMMMGTADEVFKAPEKCTVFIEDLSEEEQVVALDLVYKLGTQAFIRSFPGSIVLSSFGVVLRLGDDLSSLLSVFGVWLECDGLASMFLHCLFSGMLLMSVLLCYVPTLFAL